MVNNKPLFVRYEGRTYFPLLHFYPGSTFGGEGGEEPNYRKLAARFRAEGSGFALMPLYPYHPNESLLELPGQPPHHPSRAHWCGTDNRGRDVFARLLYGFRISISFALITTLVSYVVGITIGALLGYYGGRFDISVQRFDRDLERDALPLHDDHHQLHPAAQLRAARAGAHPASAGWA